MHAVVAGVFAETITPLPALVPGQTVTTPALHSLFGLSYRTKDGLGLMQLSCSASYRAEPRFPFRAHLLASQYDVLYIR